MGPAFVETEFQSNHGSRHGPTAGTEGRGTTEVEGHLGHSQHGGILALMNTYVAVNTFVYSVTFMSEKLVYSLKEIVRETGLNPGRLACNWESTQGAIAIWLRSRHLLAVRLEIYNPTTNKLILRWDFDVVYDADGDGSMWVDTDDLWYAIAKTGQAPSRCKYDVILMTKYGSPDVPGWSNCSLRSTHGLSRHSIGTMMSASNGLSSRAAYWS